MSGLNSGGPGSNGPGSGYRPLIWSHIRDYTAATGSSAWDKMSDARLRLTPMLGYAYFGVRGIEAVGGVFWFNRRRPEGMFAARPEIVRERRFMWVHRAAIEVVALAHRLSPVIYARSDMDVPRSVEWLERLGFAPPDYPGEWWTHGVYGSSSAGGGIVPDEQLDGRGDARLGWP